MKNEKDNYIGSSGKVILNACPGSGKTTAISFKLKELLSNWPYDFSGIACLSFTNVAKNEINQKFKDITGKFIRYPHLVSTIDSFINQYITLHFGSAIIFGNKRIRILDNNSIIDEILQKNGYFIKTYKSLLWRIKPSSIEFSSDGKLFSTYGNPQIDIFDKYCKDVKSFQFTRGLFKNSDSSFYAKVILENYKKVGKWLISRFPQIIIDEAQDTSEIHHIIFDSLISNGLSRIDLVGDPYQSLYEWRDAKPDLFLEKFEDKKNWMGLIFTENVRSTQKIVDTFSIVRKKDDPKIKSIQVSDKNNRFPVFVYKYKSTQELEIVRQYEEFCILNKFESYQVVVRGNSLKNRLLGRKSTIYPWKSNVPYDIIKIKNEFINLNIKFAINQTRSLYVSLKHSKLEFSEQKQKENELKLNFDFNAEMFSFIKNIPSFELSIKDWTEKAQIHIASLLQIKLINFELKTRNSKYFDKKNLDDKMTDHFATSTIKGMQITTIHQIKGVTLDSIMLILNENNHKENIIFNDVISSGTFPEEKQRLIYVAMSRPRYLLAIGIPDSIKDDEIYNKFGADTKIIS